MARFDLDDADLSAISQLVQAKIGIALGASKRNLVIARLASRLRALGHETFAEYYHHLTALDRDGQELQRMLNRITTNTTSFFREPQHFDYLRERLLPELLQRGRRKLRLWSAGCSTGQEPYSLAMLLAEEKRLRGWDLRILASDVDTDVLARAETGQYTEREMASVPAALRAKWFETQGATLSIRKELRDLIAFRHINLLDRPWPIHVAFDAIFCRNVLIYFDTDTQASLSGRLAAQLDANGKLFLGPSELLLASAPLLTLLGGSVYGLTAACTSGGRPQGGTWRPGPRTRPPSSRWQAPGPSSGPPRQARRAHCPELSMQSGSQHVSESPCVLRIVLGSCIAVCLFDPQAKVGGMSHLTLREGQSDGPLPRYAEHAIDTLLAAIAERHGACSRVCAKIFGGARVLPAPRASAARENIRSVRRLLSARSIPIVAERLGGDAPLCLRFETHTGRAFARVLTPMEREAWRGPQPEAREP